MDVRVFAYPTAPTDGRWILWQARSYSRSRWPRTCPTGPGSPPPRCQAVQLESRLIRWMVGIFVGSVTVVGGLLTVLLTIVNS